MLCCDFCCFGLQLANPLPFFHVSLSPKRMALSYLIGSQGHFGQTKLRSSASTVQANRADSSLVMSDSDVELLVELLANSLNHRGKGGNGGGNYLSGTFDLKCVIFSLRCLLTHTSNQEKIARLYGLELNALLMNSLARFSLEPSTIRPMDSESSGHVVFSLYLLSNHCFVHVPFLPEMYGAPQQQPKASMKEKDHGLAANILVSYLRLSNIPPEGRHAAQQLLLRLNYLNFENCTAVADFVSFLSFSGGSEFDIFENKCVSSFVFWMLTSSRMPECIYGDAGNISSRESAEGCSIGRSQDQLHPVGKDQKGKNCESKAWKQTRPRYFSSAGAPVSKAMQLGRGSSIAVVGKQHRKELRTQDSMDKSFRGIHVCQCLDCSTAIVIREHQDEALLFCVDR